jgi:hypothetical protein
MVGQIPEKATESGCVVGQTKILCQYMVDLVTRSPNSTKKGINWKNVEKMYLVDGLPYREVARLAGVSRQMIEKKGKELKWAEKRKQVDKVASQSFDEAVLIKREELKKEVVLDAIDRIARVKTEQLDQSVKLIEIGMARLGGGKPISDATAISAIRLGQETIRELEGMKKNIENQTNIQINVSPEEAKERLRLIAKEYGQINDGVNAV